MQKNRKIIILITAYILGMIEMFILPIFRSPDYSIIRNSLSDLGGQAVPLGWIMNLTFVLLAIGSVIAGWQHYNGFLLHRILLMIFGISLTLTAFFNAAPAISEIQYNLREVGWHAYFTGTAVLSFIILSFSTGFNRENQNDRLLAIAAGLSVFILSVLMSEADRLAGIWQRLIYIISFGWLIYNFKPEAEETEYDKIH